MKNKRFKKVVEWNYCPTPILLVPIGFLGMYIISCLWNHNFNYENSIVFLFIGIVGLTLELTNLLVNREVHWEEE